MKQDTRCLVSDAVNLPGGPTEYCKCAKDVFTRMKNNKSAFIRGGKVHEVEHVGKLMQLNILTASALKSRIEKLGPTFVYTKNRDSYDLTAKRPSTEACETLLETLEAKEILDPISNVFRNPIIIPDNNGAKVLGTGYHYDHGGIMISQGSVPDIPFCEAKNTIISLLDDFLFVDASDKTRMMSAIISPALRFGGFIAGNTPIHTFEATFSQTGKGYACELIESVYNEPPSLVAIKKGGVGSFDESLSERLLQGRPIIRFDNLRGKTDSQFLEMVVTAPGEVGLRIPHKPEVHANVKYFFFLATSNGLEGTEDLANRFCIIRLRMQPPGYNFKSFTDGRDIVSHIKKNSEYYLGCIFSIIKNWAVNGFIETHESRHSFREWARKVEGIIQLTWPCLAPLMDQHQEAQQRTANPYLTWLRKVCPHVESHHYLGQALNASKIAEICAEADLDITGLREQTDEDAAKKQVGLILSKCFKQSDFLDIDDFHITKNEETRIRVDGKGTFTARVYCFEKTQSRALQPGAVLPVSPQ